MPRESFTTQARPLLCVGIATRGRAAILREVLTDIAHQTYLPDCVIVCHTSEDDIAGVAESGALAWTATRFIICAPGLPRQRNAILDAAAAMDIVLFIDDDFLMESRYIETTISAFENERRIVCSTGTLIDDDTRGPGLTVAAGRAKIRADGARRSNTLDTGWRPAPHGYGCNMAFRLPTVRAHALRFDERLPLYGWSEDIDFTHRIGTHGIIAKLDGARGVHLGVKQGKSSGRRLGYAQVANPLYLFRKGSYSAGRAARSVARNVAANLARALWPEPYIDRRGRLLGNALAFLDMVRGRMAPERIIDL